MKWIGNQQGKGERKIEETGRNRKKEVREIADRRREKVEERKKEYKGEVQKKKSLQR